MSYKDRLIDLDRDAEASLTEQIAAVVRAAIDAGELVPGGRLPPTRELAELAGVNHLTAVRAYRRLRELGLVSSQVGRGTFVREAGAPPDLASAGGIGWQSYALPEVQESYGDRVISEMFRLASEGGAGVIPLSVGYPSRELYPGAEIQAAVKRVLAAGPERVLDYADIPGAPELRSELTRLLSERAVGDDPEDLVVTNGARQGLTLVTRAVLRPGDAVACEAPTFWGLLDSIRAVGARPLAVPVDADGLDVDALEALLGRHDIKAVALQPRCHNPTGRDLSPARRGRLVELARRHGFFVIEDGIYGELSLDGTPASPLRAEAPEHVVYVDSLSKTIGGGLRIGWVAASGPVRDRILGEKQRDDIHSPTVTQLAAAEYLRSGGYEGFLEDARAFYRERRDVLMEALDAELGSLATLSEPRGGGHVWVTLDPLLDEGDLTAQAVRSGVSFVPGAAMMPERPLRTMLRVSFCWLPPEDLTEGARRLGRAVRATMRRPQARTALPIA
jgi:DNA-binding transcriptional MocR family regulator